MELRHLRYFVAVAEERHFRRAAERLGVAQPALSQQVQHLERELGGPLLSRTRRSVELTEAGELFLREARRVLSDAQRAAAVVEGAKRGEEGRLELGITPSTCFVPSVLDAIRAFRAAFPKLDVALTERNTLPLLEALRGHALDAAFLRPPVEAGEDVEVEVLLEEEMLIALPAGHALASEASLPLSALRGETLLVRPRPVGQGLREQIVAACRRAGFSPIMGRHAPPQMSSVLTLVAAGLGVSVVPASMGHLLSGSVVCRPIHGARVPRAPVALAYRKSSRSAAVAAFVDFALRHAGAIAPAWPRKSVSVERGGERSRSGRRVAPSRR